MWPILTVLSTAFWMLMLFDCLRHEPDRRVWLWIVLLLNVPGALIYLVVRRLPTLNLPVPSGLNRFTRRHDLWEAEAAVRNIGKAHQYIQWGNVLLETGQVEQASEAFQTALEKETKNLGALWGRASAAVRQDDYAGASQHLATLLQLDPEFKSGEASLAYGQVLFNRERWAEAKTHLQQDVRYWGHPEAAILLAELYLREGDRAAAKQTLEEMLFRVRGAPKFHYRRKQHVVKQAERHLRSLSST